MLDETYVFVTGRLVAAPELKYLGSGMAVASFAVAVNDPKKKDSDEKSPAYFFECKAWGKTAEFLCGKNVEKGDGLVIRGSLRQEKWEAKDGTKRSAVIINVNSLLVIPKRGSQQNGGDGDNPPPKDKVPVGSNDVPF